MSGFELIAGLASAAGTVVSAMGSIQAGKDAQEKAEYEAEVQEMQADEAVAGSQRDAASRNREGQLLLSQARAAAAASGGVSDPSVIDAMGGIAEQTAYNREAEIFKGEQQSRGYNDAAAVSRVDGARARAAGTMGAIGTIFGGVSSMYSRFGQQARVTTPAAGTTRPLYG